MNVTEVEIVITTLRNYYGSLPQPEWKDAGVRQVWFDELRPFSLADGMTAVHALRDRSQALIDAGKQVWFPTLIEFTNDLRWVAVNAEREAARDEARTATIHCDGSRFIPNDEGPHGGRPFRGGDGVVPCPTCAPSLFKRWQSGEAHKRVDHPRTEKNLPPCPARAEDGEPATAETLEILHAYQRRKALL